LAVPQISAESVDKLRASLAEDDVHLDVVSISEPDDVKQVVREVAQRVLAKPREHKIDPDEVCFDTRIPDGDRIVRIQLPRSFDPTALFGAPQ
jgi:hypothetical protein